MGINRHIRADFAIIQFIHQLFMKSTLANLLDICLCCSVTNVTFYLTWKQGVYTESFKTLYIKFKKYIWTSMYFTFLREAPFIWARATC